MCITPDSRLQSVFSSRVAPKLNSVRSWATNAWAMAILVPSSLPSQCWCRAKIRRALSSRRAMPSCCADPRQHLIVSDTDVIPELPIGGRQVGLIGVDQGGEGPGHRRKFPFCFKGVILPASFCKCLIIMMCGSPASPTSPMFATANPERPPGASQFTARFCLDSESL